MVALLWTNGVVIVFWVEVVAEFWVEDMDEG